MQTGHIYASFTNPIMYEREKNIQTIIGENSEIIEYNLFHKECVIDKKKKLDN
ncbi:MAG: hypothetical protein V1859_06665 [archaeon]